MEAQQIELIKKYISLLLRHKKFIIALVYVALAAGLGFYLNTPKSYQSLAMIMYQQSKINPSKMSPDESKNVGIMVRTVAEQVLSRTNLEELIKQFDLMQEARKKLPIEDVIEIMRKKIKVDTARDTDVFKVSFTDANPQKVMRVTNALASKFVEENLRVREEKVSETKAYVKDELEMAKNTLDKKEALLRDYKLKYYNEMHVNLPTNIARLNSLQDQYQKAQESMQSQEQTRLMIQEQISHRKERIEALRREGTGASEIVVPADGREGSSENASLAQMRLRLEAMLAKYTAQHPDVRRLQKEIEQLENSVTESQELQSDKKKSPIVGNRSSQQHTVAQLAVEADLDKLQMQLKEIDLNLQNLKEERHAMTQQIEQYKKWIEATPIREAEWSALTRDYDELKKNYDTLVTTGLAADAAASMERRQKGSQFKILDPAALPEKPTFPNFIKIMLVALVLGLGGSVGLVVMLDLLDSTFKDKVDIESYLGLSVICSIPMLYTAAENKKERRAFWLWTCFFVLSTLFLGSGFAYFWLRGSIVI